MTTMVQAVMAVAVAIRSDCPARQPSPKKCATSRTATTASFPAWDNTDNRTAPCSTYMTLVAASPCAKIVAEGRYSTCGVRVPVQSTGFGLVGAVAGFFDLLIACALLAGRSSRVPLIQIGTDDRLWQPRREATAEPCRARQQEAWADRR